MEHAFRTHSIRIYSMFEQNKSERVDRDMKKKSEQKDNFGVHWIYLCVRRHTRNNRAGCTPARNC